MQLVKNTFSKDQHGLIERDIQCRLYKVDKCKMMMQNAMLRKEIKDLKATIDAFELEQNRLQTIDQKCVSTKSDAKTYSTAC